VAPMPGNVMPQILQLQRIGVKSIAIGSLGRPNYSVLDLKTLPDWVRNGASAPCPG